MIEDIGKNPHQKELPKDAADATLARVNRLENQKDGVTVPEVSAALRRTMQMHCGVFRFGDMLKEGVSKIRQVAEQAQHTTIRDKSKVFNTARVEALELDNMVEAALATMISAEARTESRGAQARDDFPDRDDEKWLKHTLYFRERQRLDYKPVHLKPLTGESFPPKARTY
jgi:succinate dehydrogenase / fumarate reductase, flavoprotein subunit